MKPRTLFLIAALLLPASGFAKAAAQTTTTTNAHLTEREKRGLSAALEQIRDRYHFPAMAAALVLDGKIVWFDAVGVRRLGSPEPALPDDAFQIGSMTKPLTATMIGVLVDKGIMRWDMTLGEVFPELADEIRPEYRRLTVVDHLAHLNGMSGDSPSPGATLMEQRYNFVHNAVKERPIVPVGTFRYGGGTIMVAAMAERLTHTPYETLMRQYIFEPLGMTTCGFGEASEPTLATAPWQHQWHPDGRIDPVHMGHVFAERSHAPAGSNLHCSVSDMMRLMIAHMPGTSPALLKPQTLQYLHSKARSASIFSVGGWQVNSNLPWTGPGLSFAHGGDNGKNHCLGAVSPDSRAAYVIITNVSTLDKDIAMSAMEKALWPVIMSKLSNY